MYIKHNALRQVQSLMMRRISNGHAHFRRGLMTQAIMAPLIRLPRYILAMPNTGPIVTIEDMLDYHEELTEVAEKVADHQVEFIMTLYLTEQTTPKVIERMLEMPFNCGVKYYPPEQGATTGSGRGIPLDQCNETLRAMSEYEIPLLGHFESVKDKDGNELPPASREGYMVDNYLWKFRDTYPDLKISFEHASTRKAVDWFYADTSGNSFITVTPQHSLFVGDDRETLGHELDCMPAVKTEDDREAITDMITSGDGGAGGDEAPHPQKKKQEGARGCWTPHAPEMYAEVFDSRNALDERFERFMSLNFPRWWGLPTPFPTDVVTFTRQDGPVPEPIPIPESDDIIVPLGWSPDGSLYHTKWQVR